MSHELPDPSLAQLAGSIREWGRELGFQQVGIADVDVAADEERLMLWLDQGRQGAMEYMQRHGRRRARPQEVIPGTLRVIAARMDYLPPQARAADEVLADTERAYVSRYALGRDYHKVLRGRLAQLAEKIRAHSASRSHRVFVDSGPILEKAFARNAGLGWIGKHTNLLHRNAGSWFFLGEILTDLPLPVDTPATNHCGTCRACIEVCPTRAIVAPYELDATRCISYLTIENRGPIPRELRPLIGNRVFGCDICQEVCPFTRKFSTPSPEAAFAARGPAEPPSGVERLPSDRWHPGTEAPSLIDLMSMDETGWDAFSRGSALRRAGWAGFRRNVAVALGNWGAPEAVPALTPALADPDPLVRQHAAWALGQVASAEARAALSSRLPRESDTAVAAEITAALTACVRRASQRSDAT